MTKSMTGFGSSRYLDSKIEIYCEIKTVNHRFLEISTKPNDLHSELDVHVRDITSKKIRRGSVDIRFKLKFPTENKFLVNNSSLDNLIKTIKNIKHIKSEDLSFTDVKDIPGIINVEQVTNIKLNLVKKVFKESLKNLLDDRALEGAKIEKLFLQKINKIEKNALSLSSSNKKLTKKRYDNLNSKISNLALALDKSRIEQEVALLVLKHDVAEEIERIIFHTKSLKQELGSKVTSGKKIDFVLQELFRETSTLSVKLDEPSYKQIALEMKLSVEEMREQAQNIE